MGPLNWLRGLVFEPTLQLNDDDIVVFVMGPGGSGKSTFVRAVTQASGLIEVGQNLRVATKRVQAIRCELTDKARQALRAGERKNIVLVDTPSFCIDPEAHSKAVDETASWLKKSRSRPPCSRFGTIYLHRIEMDPEADDQYHIQKQLDAFASAFPQDYATYAFPQRLHCVFSRTDKVKEDKTTKHKEECRMQLVGLRPKVMSWGRLAWEPSVHPDFFADGDPDTAWQAIEKLFSTVVESGGIIPWGVPRDEPQEEDKLSEPSRLAEEDIVVFVVGPSGSGKSTFIRAVTQAPGLVEIGQNLQASAKKVQAIRCELSAEARRALGANNRQKIVFVDTPTFRSDPEAHNKAVDEMASWLKKSRIKSNYFGTIYLHGIDMDPEADHQYRVQKQLDTFAGTFPQDLTTRAFPQRLHCVFSDIATKDKTTEHKETFRKQLIELRPKVVSWGRLAWQSSIHPDLFDGDPNTAWQAVEKLFPTVHPRVGSGDIMSEDELQEEDELSEQSQTDSSDDQVPVLEEEDINVWWIDERFGPDSSNCISLPILS